MLSVFFSGLACTFIGAPLICPPSPTFHSPTVHPASYAPSFSWPLIPLPHLPSPGLLPVPHPRTPRRSRISPTRRSPNTPATVSRFRTAGEGRSHTLEQGWGHPLMQCTDDFPPARLTACLEKSIQGADPTHFHTFPGPFLLAARRQRRGPSAGPSTYTATDGTGARMR